MHMIRFNYLDSVCQLLIIVFWDYEGTLSTIQTIFINYLNRQKWKNAAEEKVLGLHNISLDWCFKFLQTFN